MIGDNFIDLNGLSVCVGMPAARDINPLVVRSLLGTQQLCMERRIPFCFALIAGNAIIQWARDEVIELFLETKANRLFWIDSDIIWKPEDFMRLLAISQKREVVCGSYPAKKDFPTFYLHYDEDKFVTDDLGLLDVNGIGMGFFVMHREIVEKLHEKAPKIYDEISDRKIAQIFKVGHTVDNKRQGEDMAFFNDIRELGYKVKLDPSISLGHAGYKVYEGSIMDAFQ